MIEKLKVCLIGATGVGKTSLMTRFVHSIFSDKYRTTIGVKIEAKEIQRGDLRTKLVIWDLSGEDEFQSVQPAYLRGAAGCLIVVDGSRQETFDTALRLMTRARTALGDVPFVVALNKADLVASWDVDDDERRLRSTVTVTHTSAKTGEGVEQTFHVLVDAIHEHQMQPRTPPPAAPGGAR